ncbi:hypothetical protein BC936DRAFT_136719 [Jimgerdemannia flammicorona]|uniref:Uncharacterized protein n=1 Tax=Jimgerdemannia flammicorona TaxID=994334 RepID=A0A433DJE1_9FUNG|nr:hypothetical protein BC936DRAFT_136719 [Jimgerdemannia flammicorona]
MQTLSWLIVIILVLLLLTQLTNTPGTTYSHPVVVLFRQRIADLVNKALGYRRLPFFNTGSFEQDIEDGLTSSTFDLNQNLEDGDTRPGLSDTDEIKRIMKRRGVSFDEARLIRQDQLLKKNNIDPVTGLSLDPKAVYFASGPSSEQS